MILSWLIGLGLIVVGIAWALLSWFAAGMADREPTLSELLAPAWGLIPIVIGAVVIWFR